MKKEFHFIDGVDDEDDRELIRAHFRGELKPVKHQKKFKAMLQRAAQRSIEEKEAKAEVLKKEARINIRMTGADLEDLKRLAAEEGMPYQTLIASILHKYVTGRLKDVRAGKR